MSRLKHGSKAKSKKEQKLDTADDFQAVGVDFEEAAGKWRAGDAAKSVRFFQRAVDVYDRGLLRFPRSVDLAYNKARVQLEVATHPMLVDQLPKPLKDALEEALSSHRYALQLDPDNADTLFNTSQVLTAIAEVIATDEDDEAAGADAQALKALREALELQKRCLDLQEQRYQDFLEQERAANEQGEDVDIHAATPGGSAVASDSGAAEGDGEWFNVVEPVTRNTLVDTVLAQLATLTTFCSILSSSPRTAPADALAWAEELSVTLLEKAHTVSSDRQDRLQEVALARGNLISSMLEAGYRSGKIDAEIYKRERDAAFAAAALQLENYVDGLIANARSLIAFNSALAESENGDAQSQSATRWNVLTASIAGLKSASAVQSISQDDLATTHLLRGDASLCLYAMALPPTSHQTAANTAVQNAKNAEVYYRNASRLSQNREYRDIALMKSAVAQYLQACAQGHTPGDLGALLNASPRDPEWAVKQLEDMVAENLIPQSLLS